LWLSGFFFRADPSAHTAFLLCKRASRRAKAERPSEAQSDTAPAVERRQDATAEIKIIDKSLL